MVHASLFIIAAKCSWASLWNVQFSTDLWGTLSHSFPQLVRPKSWVPNCTCIISSVFFIKVRQVCTDGLKVLSRFTVHTWTYRLDAVQPLRDLRKGWVKWTFTHVEFHISRNFLRWNSIQFTSIFFVSRAGNSTNLCFEMYNKKIKTIASTKENII